MNRRDRDRKLTAEEHRKLVEEYGIVFDGPIPPTSWPCQYAQIFSTIREIERLIFDEYELNEKRSVFKAVEMQRRVKRLTRIA